MDCGSKWSHSTNSLFFSCSRLNSSHGFYFPVLVFPSVLANRLPHYIFYNSSFHTPFYPLSTLPLSILSPPTLRNCWHSMEIPNHSICLSVFFTFLVPLFFAFYSFAVVLAKPPQTPPSFSLPFWWHFQLSFNRSPTGICSPHPHPPPP